MKKEIVWHVEKRKVADLKPHPDNARIFTEKGMQDLKRSINSIGMAQPINITPDGVVLSGHARLMALQEKGVEEVDVYIPNRELTEKEQQEVLIRMNANIAGIFDWDKAANVFEMDDLTDWGLEIPDLEVNGEEKEVVEDEVPKKVETRCKRGDIWKLGDHRLMCGDSTCITDVEKLMDGQKADMVFTDMPYGMNLDTDYSSMKNNLVFAKEKNFTGGKKYAQGKVDDFTPEMVNNIFACFNYVKEMFLFGADYFAELLPNKNDGSWIVWDKRANGNDDIEQDLSSDKMYGSCFELCWSKNKHKRDIARIKWACVFGTEKEFDHKRHHPTQKPTLLVQWFLHRYSKDNQSIVDLFGGSGSTLIACEKLNRKCFMMELDEHYCDVIIQRWENLTGKTAEKIN